MAYGTIKIDTITFTDGGIDKSVAISGLVQNPTFTGNVTVTGTISGNTVRGQTISGVTVTGTTANFTSGNFTNISGGTHTITSGVFASGTAANPSISFVSDPNSGLYSPGADQVAISTNGTGRLFVDASGNIGVGDTPGVVVDINDSGTGMRFRNATTSSLGLSVGLLGGTSSADAYVFHRANGPLIFGTNNAERMRLDSSGRLGLGTSSVRGTSLLDARGDISFGSNATYYGLLSYNAGTGHFESTSSDGGFKWIRQSGPATSMTLDSSGRLGIGSTSDPGSIGSRLWIDSSSDTYYTINTTGSSNLSGIHFRNSNGNGEARILNNTGGALTFYRSPGNEAARIDSSGRLLVGTSTATGNTLTQAQKLIVSHSGQNTYTGISVIGHTGTESVAAPVLSIHRSRGTSDGSYTEVASGDALGYLIWTGADGAAWSEAASIKAEADGDWTTSGDTTDSPGRLVFSVTQDGSASPTERIRLENAGRSLFFSSGNGIAVGVAAGAGTTTELFAGIYSRTSTTAGGSASIIIYSNGNVLNTNNSYGSLSDVKLKENIVDANSQWDDLKALQVRKYNFKEGQTHTQIGLVAQEVELVSPGLVYESPDRDEDGNDLGTVTKSVNYSVLYMKAVKALQEAMERIETLEAKVAALEGV